jgi:predicted RNA-binding Zn-ribbon protein involved in translation (DUF1610 family)
MPYTTDARPYTCDCGHKLSVRFYHNGYCEWPVFFDIDRGVTSCPDCGRKLVYRL